MEKKIRIIKGNETTKCSENRTIRPGDILSHAKFGRVSLDRVVTDYTTDLIIVTTLDLEHNDIIIRPATEFIKEFGFKRKLQATETYKLS